MNYYRKSEIPPEMQEYFEPAEIGLEPTPEAYVEKLVLGISSGKVAKWASLYGFVFCWLLSF